jgi:hypothetical protein
MGGRATERRRGATRLHAPIKLRIPKGLFPDFCSCLISIRNEINVKARSRVDVDLRVDPEATVPTTLLFQGPHLLCSHMRL